MNLSPPPAGRSDDMAQKLMKLKIHPRNFCGESASSVGISWRALYPSLLVCDIWNNLSVDHNLSVSAEEELIVNVDALSRDKFQVAVDDIIEISVPDGATNKYG